MSRFNASEFFVVLRHHFELKFPSEDDLLLKGLAVYNHLIRRQVFV